MARDDKKEEEQLEEKAESQEAEVQIVTNEQLTNFKLDKLLEKVDLLLENSEKKQE